MLRTDNRMVIQIGEEIGGYQVAEQVGSGGMATVYKAHHPRLRRDVALKVLYPNFSQDPEFLARFEREARIVASLDHPNIIPIYDYSEHENQPYLVMKYVHGQTLKGLLQEGPLPPEEVLRVMSAVADALSYAHRQGVLHRDIKPSNVLLDEHGTPYLTDFGLARLVQSGETTMSVDTMLGTPYYISPEQARGDHNLDARTDVYSLGVMLYELVTGQVPFTDRSSYAIVNSHINTPPPSPRAINPELPPAVENVLLKALAKNPADRYATPTALLDDYRSALHGATISAPRKQVTPRRDDTARPEPGKAYAKAMRDTMAWSEKSSDEIRQSWDDYGEEMRRYWEEKSQKWTSWNWFGENSQDDDYEYDSTLTDEQRLRRRVEQRITDRNELLSNVFWYLVVNGFLWFIWIASGAGNHPWPIWPTLGWGIGVAASFFEYHNKHGAGRDRRERMIREEMERERRRMYGSEKPKNDVYDGPVRLTQDGELTDSFVDDIDYNRKQKRN